MGKFLNYLRNKFHPLFWLFKFQFIRKFLSKTKIKFLKKSKKFGDFYIFLPRNISLLLINEHIELNTFNLVSKLNLKRDIKNSSFVDVGGNVGIYSLYFKKNYNSKVFIFEPDDNNLNLLINTKLKNNYSNFHIFPFGLTNEEKMMSFLIDDISGSTGTFSKERNIPQIRMGIQNKKDIISMKLDTFKKVINNISWVKIDVEGHEIEVIQGMIEIIKRDEPNLIIESNDIKISKIYEMLKPLNYKLNKIDQVPNYILFK